MNSTGVCIIREDDWKDQEDFVIVKSGTNKLTKREQQANELSCFSYHLAKWMPLDAYADNNHFHEYWKTYNMISVAEGVAEVVKEYTKQDKDALVWITIEGVSYGSTIRTRSVFDLAGLNYLIRSHFVEKDRYRLCVCPPAEVKKFACGVGNAKKEVIVNMFSALHEEIANVVPKVDDIADAYFMAKISKRERDEALCD